MLKKIVLASISFFLLFSIILTNTQADEKVIPESYSYVFKVGSTDFSGIVDGEKVEGSLLYPITINKKHKRAGYDIWFCCPSKIDLRVNWDGQFKTYTFNYHNNSGSILNIEYPNPNQKAFIDEKEIPLEFPIEKYQRTNDNANYCGNKSNDSSTFLAPLRLVFEFTGHSVDWNPDTQEITVTYPAKQ
jgi:hypothetical protein